MMERHSKIARMVKGIVSSQRKSEVVNSFKNRNSLHNKN